MEETAVLTYSSETIGIAGYDPFDEPLETQFKDDEELILDDIYFEQARNSVTLDGMTFSYMQPPYINFENQSKAKKKIIEWTLSDPIRLFRKWEDHSSKTIS